MTRPLEDLVRRFRATLSDRAVLGPFSKSSDPAFVEIMGHAGFDFVVLDLEHGPNTVLSLQGLVRAAVVAGLLPIVRVKEDSQSLIGEVLDIGAGGVQVPMVRSARDVEEVTRRARFAPLGMRGVCRFVRAASYSSMDRYTFFEKSNEALIVLQLEGTEAIANLDEILAARGADIVFIGPYDLSQSLGVPGDVDGPVVMEAMRGIVDKCLKRGIVVGTFVDTLQSARHWRDAGVRYICYSVDVGLFTEKCSEVVRSLG